VLPFPVLDNDELAKIVHINATAPGRAGDRGRRPGLYRRAGGGEA
jgi:hypothetical protein